MDLIIPELFLRGGWCMYPILGCSILALGLFIDRMFKLRRSKVMPADLHQGVGDLITRGKFADAIFLCQGHASPLARIYHAALKSAGQPRQAIKEVVEEVGRREADDLSQYIPFLSTIATISPLLGLLGTVSGMIKIFNVLSYYGGGNTGALALGISEALITTYAGLTVAIPTLVAYRVASSRADRLIADLERQAINLVEKLKGPER